MSLLKRLSIGTFGATLVGLMVLTSVARADCPACATMLTMCGQSVLTTFQSCITGPKTRAAMQACVSAGTQGFGACQSTFAICIAACTPAE